jgi:hypothetical protein
MPTRAEDGTLLAQQTQSRPPEQKAQAEPAKETVESS